MSDETAPRILNVNAAGMNVSPAGVVWQNRRLVRSTTDRQDRPARVKTNNLIDDVPFNGDYTVRHVQTALRDLSYAGDPCAGEAIDDSTKNYPIRSPDVDWACVDIKGIQGATGHVGVDPVMGDCATGQCYSPGNNHTDPFYGACVMSNSGCNSYYKVHHFGNGGNDFPFGIFINNADKNYCVDAPWCRHSEILAHNWANRISAVHLELYSHDERHGGASIWADGFSRLANGGVYSRDLGIVTLPDGSNLNPDPTTGEYAVAKLNGYVFTRAADTPRPGRATLHLWGNTSRVTTTGVKIQGFASASNIEGGYYSSGWLYPANTYAY